MKYILLLFVVALVLVGCKKDTIQPDIPKAYTYITLNDIKALEGKMSSDEDVKYPDPGNVIIYKTNKGVFGKLRIIYADHLNDKLYLEFVNYNNDGSELLIKYNLEFTTSAMSIDIDLDTGTKTSDDLISDFKWFQDGAGTQLRPLGFAKFYHYSN